MTIGQRIAQKRKEVGFSQEALGEQMGVSRQAIYKWESDTALPEIEKLVALSKLFGVSVGWLLGVEEDAASRQTEPDTMNQDQLDMVEQIVSRYIEAQPKPKPRRKWPWVLAVCILVVMFILLFSRIDQLSSQYNNLQNSVSNISYSVNSQIGGIASRVEAILKAQNQLVAEYSTRIVATDYRDGTVTISAEAVPKTYVQGMGAVFLVDYGNGQQEFDSILVDNHAFTCETVVPLTDSITVSVVFITADGTRQTQVLESYSYLLSDSYAGLNIHEDLMFSKVKDGNLGLKGMYVWTDQSYSSTTDAQIVDYQIGIFRNQRLLGWAEKCDKPVNYTGFDGYQFFRLPDLAIEDLGKEDTIEIAALVTDSYGRQYMFCDVPYCVNSSGTELTWVSAVEYDRDPACWTFE